MKINILSSVYPVINFPAEPVPTKFAPPSGLNGRPLNPVSTNPRRAQYWEIPDH